MSEDILVEVAYALPQKQEVLSLKIRSGALVSDAIARSGILRDFPEIDLATAKVGVYGKQVKLDAVLRDKDRVEIYRPLIADPKEIRRKRAAEGKEVKKEAAGAEAAPTWFNLFAPGIRRFFRFLDGFGSVAVFEEDAFAFFVEFADPLPLLQGL